VTFEWHYNAMDWLLASSIEPGEVLSVLQGARRRWPRPTYAPGIGRLVTIWGVTPTGRGLIIVTRPLGGFDQEIVAARVMTAAELREFHAWEESGDE
jgi:hypothetical protein